MALMNTDVAIIGAGPVGLALAAQLRNSPYKFEVFELGEDLPRESEASTIHASTLELLADLEVADPFIAVGEQVRSVQYRDEHRDLVAEMHFSVLAGDTQYPFRLHSEQWRLTPLLLDQVREHVHFRSPLIALDYRGDHAEMVVQRNGRPRTVRARWVVGADGAHSTVRKAAGIPFNGHKYPFRLFWIKTPLDLREVVPDLSSLVYIVLDNDDVALLGHRDHWRIVYRIPEREVPRASNEAYLQGKLEEALPELHIPIGEARVIKLSRRLAGTYRQGPVLLVGDAAHLCGTHGGFNMNTGIHDACALGRTLCSWPQGGVELDRALDAWARDRRSVMDEVVVPRSEGSGAPVFGGKGAKQRAAWKRYRAEVASSSERMRRALREASLLDVKPAFQGPGKGTPRVWQNSVEVLS